MTYPKEVTFEVNTSSKVMDFDSLPTPTPPELKINGVVVPLKQAPTWPTGFRVTVINSAENYADPNSILLDALYYVAGSGTSNLWANTYQEVYQHMVHGVLSAGNINQQLLIMSSFGLDANMPPTNGAYRMAIESGAGSQLQHWETSVDIGSQVGNSTSWVSFPANYILIGFAAWSYGQGFEKYDQNGTNPVNSTLTATVANVEPPPTSQS